MPDWGTIASLATAGSTLVLSVATFASVRSGNRTARAAERGLQVSLRPLLGASRLDDPVQKVGFADEHWVQVAGSYGAAEVTESAIYLVMSLRNAGSGAAVLHGWHIGLDQQLGVIDHAPLDSFHRLSRDIYVPAKDLGFWQGALRDPSTAEFAATKEIIEAGQRLVIQLMYGDQDGGQRTITLFSMRLTKDDRWLVSAARHWNLDGSNPR